MWVQRIRRIVEKNRDIVQGILLRQYPAFILSDRVDDLVEIPTFVFHDVTVEFLEPMLRFLSYNRYTTLTADEYIERQARGERGHEREVMLTFDDGHKTLYDVAYPALKRFGFRAVAYIVPGEVPEGDGVYIPELQANSLCNWKEIQEMHESEILDIQSHSMHHHSIPLSGCLVDFLRKDIKFPSVESYLALPLEAEGKIKKSYRYAYGTPIYDGGPRYGDAPAYRESPSVRIACTEYVNRHGGQMYFQTPKWRPRIQAVMEEARRRNPGAGLETEVEQHGAILKDLRNSKHEIEQRLPGKTVRHLCFPWFLGSALAVKLSAQAGYISNAWGSPIPNFVRHVHRPVPVARYSPPYFWRLPGKGRKPIGNVLRERLSQVFVRSSANC